MDAIEKLSLKLVNDFAQCSNGKDESKLLKSYLQEFEGNTNSILPAWPTDICWINVAHLNPDDFIGKVLLLDFFTYCCINCIHIMPFLHKIDSKYSQNDGFLVVGVHSAKFPNEKVSDNIVNALERYDIKHPVINDFRLDLWNGLNIKCWPTLLLINPRGKIMLSLPGETHTHLVEALITEALSFYKDQITSDKIDVMLIEPSVNALKTKLKFPGKIAVDDTGSRLAIADTANNRIIVCDVSGGVQHLIGSGKSGKKDGSFSSCSFCLPQGVTWHRSNSLFVADCDNHMIRKIDLLVMKVVTVAGTGQIGNDQEGGHLGTDQVICSPWDVVVGGSPRFSDAANILYVAMSGIHQIWAFFLQDADWQKGSQHEMGTCLKMAGNGQEENRNNSYPHKAGFAQPSGLSVDDEDHKLYVADSESSTIRRINLSNGAVEGVVGGHFDPTNLFAFGDQDGKARNAKLQHPLGVAWDKKRKRLFVADSYNHKIKIVDPVTKVSTTLCGPEVCEVKDASSCDLASVYKPINLNEPGGICIDPKSEFLYIADTNNHDVKVLTLSTGQCESLQLQFSSESGETVTDSVPITKPEHRHLANRNTAKWHRLDAVKVGPSSILRIHFRIQDIRLTADAPSQWQLTGSQQKQGLEEGEEELINSGKFPTHDPELTVDIHVSDLLSLCCKEISDCASTSMFINLVWEATLYYCLSDSQLCLMKDVIAVVPLDVDSSMQSSAGDTVSSVNVFFTISD